MRGELQILYGKNRDQKEYSLERNQFLKLFEAPLYFLNG